MVRPERLELPAYWFEASRSIQLSYGRTIVIIQVSSAIVSDVDDLARVERGHRMTEMRAGAFKGAAHDCAQLGRGVGAADRAATVVLIHRVHQRADHAEQG